MTCLRCGGPDCDGRVIDSRPDDKGREQAFTRACTARYGSLECPSCRANDYEVDPKGHNHLCYACRSEFTTEEAVAATSREEPPS